MGEFQPFWVAKKFEKIHEKFKELCKLKEVSMSKVICELIAEWVDQNRTDKLDTFMEAKPAITLDMLPRIHEPYDTRILEDLDTQTLGQIHENSMHTKWGVEKIMDKRNRAKEDKLRV